MNFHDYPFPSHAFGFGLMDAGRMVEMAEKWKLAPPQQKCSEEYNGGEEVVRAGWQTRLNITVGGCDSVQVVILMFSPLWCCFSVSCVWVCRVYFEYHCQWLRLCYNINVQAQLLHIMTIGS